jgi:hypothetical protein
MDETELAVERAKLMSDIAGALQGKINDSLTSIQRTMQIGVALLAAVFAATFARGQYGVLLVVPMSLGLLLSYQLQMYSDMMAAGWQRQELIKSIEVILGPLDHPDVGLSRHAGANPSLVITKLSYLSILVSSSIAGYWILSSLQVSAVAYIAYSLSVLLSLAAVAWSAIENRASWDRCQRATELASDNLPYEVKMDELLGTLGMPGEIWRQSRFAARSLLKRIRTRR